MRDVWEMSYDIEDNLDDFMICINDDKSAKNKRLMKKCKNLLDKMNPHKRIQDTNQESGRQESQI